MIFYLALPLIVLLIGAFCRNFVSPQKQDIAFIAISFSALFFLMAFRASSVGMDTANYARMYTMIGRAPFATAITGIIVSAPVYCFICKVTYLICHDPQAISVVSAAIICCCFAAFLYHFSENVMGSVYCFITLWFFSSSMNITRQYMAVALIALAYVTADEKRWIITIMLALLSIGIHNTALLAVPFLFLKQDHISLGKLLGTIVMGLIAILVIRFLFNTIAVGFARIFPRYSMYFGAASHSFNDEGQGDNILLNVFYLAFIALSTLVFLMDASEDDIESSRNIAKLLPMSMMGIVMGFVSSSNLALGRARVFYLTTMCCLIPNVINRVKHRELFSVACYAVMLIPYYISIDRNISSVVPYVFCFK